MIPEEQVNQIKNQIIQQIESTFPEDKKGSAKQQIELMGSEQLEEFLEKNTLMQKNQNPAGNKCIFCSIISEKIYCWNYIFLEPVKSFVYIVLVVIVSSAPHEKFNCSFSGNIQDNDRSVFTFAVKL